MIRLRLQHGLLSLELSNLLLQLCDACHHEPQARRRNVCRNRSRRPTVRPVLLLNRSRRRR